MDELINKAKEEMVEKTFLEIQKDMAELWAARAYAAYEFALTSENLAEMHGWFMQAEKYRELGLKHAVLIEEKESALNTLEFIWANLEVIRDYAISIIYAPNSILEEEMGDRKDGEETVLNEDKA